MNNEQLKLLIAEGEGLTVEFKEKYTSKIDRDIVALANSRGGFILLGVSDDGRITSEKLTNQLKAELSSLARNCDPHISITKITQIGDVVAIEVSEGLEKPYSCSSGYFRRLDGMTQKMTQKEVRLIFRAAADLSFESLPCKGFSFENVQLGKVRTFLKEAGASLKVTGTNLPAFLSSLGIHADNTINNAGALMFASDINRFIPHCETIMAAFKGVEKVHIYDRKDARADLLTQFNDGMDFIRKQLNVRSEIYIDRKEIYEIPLDALREALINALVHRDYSMRGTSIYVNVFDDRVDISNPGGLLPGVTTRNFGKESVRRNPIIADLFHRMGKVERMGTGIKRMKDLMREAGLKEPEFTSDTFFHAVFYRNPEYSLKL
ncbi:MAG: ATP-binding protein, partial [Elusimicrobiota bacterium]|nr:ATP-binding protein [Elusimicrobiota bacterium]